MCMTCNLHEERCETGDIMCERNLDIVAQCETRLKDKGETRITRFKRVKSRLPERICVRQDIAVAMKDKIWGVKIEESKFKTEVNEIQIKTSGRE